MREQAEAVDGFVDGHRVHAAFNLVAVCDKCHVAHHLHQEEATKEVVKKTSRGRRVVPQKGKLDSN